MSERGPPLIGRGKSLLEQLLRIVQTRLELLALELQEEKLALTQQIRLIAVATLCAFLAAFTLIIWIAVAAPPGLRSWLLGLIFAMLLATTLTAGTLIQRNARRREPLFKRVAEQLRLDRAALGEELIREEPP